MMSQLHTIHGPGHVHVRAQHVHAAGTRLEDGKGGSGVLGLENLEAFLAERERGRHTHQRLVLSKKNRRPDVHLGNLHFRVPKAELRSPVAELVGGPVHFWRAEAV